MKTLLLFFLLLFSAVSYGQVDTANLRSGKLTLRLNDWEYVATFINNENYEGLYDSIKNRVRALSVYPTGSTLITVDSVVNSELNYLCFAVKAAYNKSNSTASDRIVTAIVGLNSWIANMQNLYDTDEGNIFSEKKRKGKRILTKKTE